MAANPKGRNKTVEKKKTTGSMAASAASAAGSADKEAPIPKMAEEKMSLKEGRSAKKKARKDKRATKLRAKATKVEGGSKSDFKDAKKKARQDKRAAKKDIKSQTKDARKTRRKKVGRVAAAVATGGKSEVVRAVAKKVKNRPNKGKLKAAVKDKVNTVKDNVKDKVGTVKRKTKAAVTAFQGTPMYDGQTPDLGSMSDGMSQYGMKKPGMGMYGKGSQIQYGQYSGKSMASYNKSLSSGGNMSSMVQTSANTVLKHGANKTKKK